MASDSVLAYDAIAGCQSLRIQGNVALKGKLPNPRRYNLVVSLDPCYGGLGSDGKGWRLSSSVHLSRKEGISKVIVFLKDIQKGKPFSRHPQTLKVVNCRFSPSIALLHEGETARVESWDPVNHRLEMYQRTQSGGRFLVQQAPSGDPTIRQSDFLMNKKHGTHRLGSTVLYQANDPGPLLVRCRVHAFMEGWAIVPSHPYFSLTDGEGSFSDADFPTGDDTLVLWNP